MNGTPLVRRLAQTVPAILGVILVGFLLVQVAPGDPVFALGGEFGDEAYYEFMRERFDLDRPWPVQLTTYARRVVSGDLGTSYVQGRPVLAIISERLPATLLLTVSALVVSTVIGVTLGILSATRPFSPRDLGISGVTLVLYAAPVFWLGQLAILFVAYRVGWLPIQGMSTAGGTASGAAAVIDIARHLFLPALVLASQGMVAVSRLTRSEMLLQLTRPHIRTARAKGLTERTVLVRHALRLALLPLMTLLGHRVGHLVAGAAIVEIVFGWPGIGRLMLDAVQARDTPILLGLFVLMAFAVVIANVLTDLVYRPLDARVRATGS